MCACGAPDNPGVVHGPDGCALKNLAAAIVRAHEGESDTRRDMAIADAVLATLKNSDIGEMRAITMTKAILAAIERVERSRR
jgi:cobalamin biosynthesis protein CbiD